MITNVLSVDVEEYYHAAIFQRGTSAGNGSRAVRAERGAASRCSASTVPGARSSWWGKRAAQHPAMVRRIAAEGHEIGCTATGTRA